MTSRQLQIKETSDAQAFVSASTSPATPGTTAGQTTKKTKDPLGYADESTESVHATPTAEDVGPLPSQIEARRSNFAKELSSKLDSLQAALFSAGQTLNDVTGYTGIERLKRAIEAQERSLTEARAEVKEAKDAYASAIARRSGSQREVNELLQRKHAWTPEDLERFTELYRSDHANEQAEAQTHERLTRAEHVADDTQAELGRAILARYHEEQIWSDKIRRASTYGTWALMGINVLLFVVVQLGLEPWKRRRLIGSFEEKVQTIIDDERLLTRTEIQNLLLGKQAAEPATVPESQSVAASPVPVAAAASSPTPSAFSSRHTMVIHSFTDLISLFRGIFIGSDMSGASIPADAVYSSTRIDLAVWSTVSAATGAAIVGLVAALVHFVGQT
ncbi:Mdm33 family-domain-containing protein [Limtongia smithiae]|uniref:Mdm33 family-domain-containing protein n=1 Tax=Limtongia smithiae TaxID=1125753 RepID=UPI0034CE456A